MDIHIPTIDELKRALHLQEGIDLLKSELVSILGGRSSIPVAYTGAKRGRKPGRKAKAAAAAGDTVNNGAPAGKKAKKKRVMSPEAREKIAAAQRKRWAKTKKAAK
jgi:hypothetical protein